MKPPIKNGSPFPEWLETLVGLTCVCTFMWLWFTFMLRHL